MLSHREVPTHLTLPTALDERRIRDVLDAQRALEQRRAQRPALRARLTARLLGARLDRALIAGADPASAPPLAARAARLASRDVRCELAAGLELVLASAQRPPSRMRQRPRHASILANAPLLRELAATLRGSAPVYVGGVAMLRRLLSDGTGPLYAAGQGASLERELHRTRAALRGA
jgi:hypothetical protein